MITVFKDYGFLIILLISTFCQAQQFDVKTYGEKTPNGYSIHVDNNEFAPVSIEIVFNLTNMTVEGGNSEVYIIPARSKKHFVTRLSQINKRKPYKYSYKTRINYGNHHLDTYDENHIYDLPFEKNKEYKLYQGYNGTETHQNQNALDFTMPIGTEILAARAGIVTKVIAGNTKTCFKKECEKYNNKIIIYHDDGTFAEYAHLKHNGAAVKVGQKISQGQLIGYSGNVGYSDGPHLHFVVFHQLMRKRRTLQTKFKIDSGDTVVSLEEKRLYKRDY